MRRLELVDGLLRQPGWRPTVSGKDEEHQRWLQDHLKNAGREPPAISELRDGMGGRDPIPLLRILEREGVVVPVEPERFYDAAVVAEMMQELRDGMQDGRAAISFGSARCSGLRGSSSCHSSSIVTSATLRNGTRAVGYWHDIKRGDPFLDTPETGSYVRSAHLNFNRYQELAQPNTFVRPGERR
jgi:hypothetical protein